jgi:hypothetical protein
MEAIVNHRTQMKLDHLCPKSSALERENSTAGYQFGEKQRGGYETSPTTYCQSLEKDLPMIVS